MGSIWSPDAAPTAMVSLPTLMHSLNTSGISVACQDCSPSMPNTDRIIELLTSLVHFAPVMFGVSETFAVHPIIASISRSRGV